MKINKVINEYFSILLSAAVFKLYPDVIFGEKLLEEESFFCDFLFKNPISETELQKIQREIIHMIKSGYKLIPAKKSLFLGQEYKNKLSDHSNIYFYNLINSVNKKVIFKDYSVSSNLDIKVNKCAIKLLSLGGSYWQGNNANKQFTRIHAIACEDNKQLEEYQKLMEERKHSDHRVIGKKMEIFSFELLSGQGFPNWLENGMILKNEIQSYIKSIEKKYGFKEVSTSIIGDKKLYETSGHLKHYKDDMFPVIKVHDEELILRPMTCPHHILLYKAKPHAYTEFPIRYSEQSRLYRYEKSGALLGLERVRSMELTEGHVFVRKDQIQSEFKNCFELIKEVLAKFNIKISHLSLSLFDLNDKQNDFDNKEILEKANNDLRSVLNSLKIKYVENIGDAAFYGPKVDIQVITSMQKEITVSTLQLDFLLPMKFGIHYLNKDGKLETPILLHRGLIGTYERFIAILLEQTKGDLPFWLSPYQIIVIPIDPKKHLKFAKVIENKLLDMNYRVKLDSSEDRLAKKIRSAQVSKIKLQFIIGENEVKNKQVSIRKYGSSTSELIDLSKIEEFLKKQ